MSSPSPLYRDDFLRLLEEVDARLPEGQVIPVTIVGGAAITIIWDDRYRRVIRFAMDGSCERIANATPPRTTNGRKRRIM